VSPQADVIGTILSYQISDDVVHCTLSHVLRYVNAIVQVTKVVEASDTEINEPQPNIACRSGRTSVCAGPDSRGI
jgi:hypothetical protein